ncbi:MAG: hypothetical protein V1934_03555 [Methanobacteriota archaeon]
MHMCKYRYRDGRCASGDVTGMSCVGESQCPVHNPDLMPNAGGSTRVISTEGEDGITEQFLKWNGLYCPKHKAFYCAAEGECTTCGISRDEHRESMDKFAGQMR